MEKIPGTINNTIVLMTVKKNIIIRKIIAGKNYSISVIAISKNVESKENIIYRFIEPVGPEKNMVCYFFVLKFSFLVKKLIEEFNYKFY